MGESWGRLEGVLASPEAVWGTSCRAWSTSWGVLGALWGVLGTFLLALGASWAVLGAFWAVLGRLGAVVGPFQRRSGDRPGVVCGRFGGQFGMYFELSLGRSGCRGPF